MRAAATSRGCVVFAASALTGAARVSGSVDFSGVVSARPAGVGIAASEASAAAAASAAFRLRSSSSRRDASMAAASAAASARSARRTASASAGASASFRSLRSSPLSVVFASSPASSLSPPDETALSSVLSPPPKKEAMPGPRSTRRARFCDLRAFAFGPADAGPPETAPTERLPSTSASDAADAVFRAASSSADAVAAAVAGSASSAASAASAASGCERGSGRGRSGVPPSPPSANGASVPKSSSIGSDDSFPVPPDPGVTADASMLTRARRAFPQSRVAARLVAGRREPPARLLLPGRVQQQPSTRFQKRTKCKLQRSVLSRDEIRRPKAMGPFSPDVTHDASNRDDSSHTR